MSDEPVSAKLDPAHIKTELGGCAALFDIAILDTCESTNAMLLNCGAERARAGRVLACELQTAGRGRRGTVWHAPRGSGLTFSLLWTFSRNGAALGGLPLAVGVACARAIEHIGKGAQRGKACAQVISLKWPNDLLHAGAKLGGILIETRPLAKNGCLAVIGIGINVLMSESQGRALGGRATDLTRVLGETPDRNRLLASLLRELAPVLSEFDAQGFKSFRAEWLRRHAFQDRDVRLYYGAAPSLQASKGIEGRAIGVDEDGALLVECAGARRRVLSAEVSLRPA